MIDRPDTKLVQPATVPLIHRLANSISPFWDPVLVAITVTTRASLASF